MDMEKEEALKRLEKVPEGFGFLLPQRDYLR